MLQLDSAKIVGSGVDRVVYAHPDDPDLCVKIPRCNFKNDFKVQGVRDFAYYVLRSFNKEYFDFNFTNVLYVSKITKKVDEHEVYEHIPRCYGFVETYLGRGVLWQRLRDYDGSACVTLKDICFERLSRS